MRRPLLLALLLLLFAAGSARAAGEGEYPARCRVTTNLNIRSAPTRSAAKVGMFHRNEYITVEEVTGAGADTWGAVTYGSKRCYVSMRYLEYDAYVGQPQTKTILGKTVKSDSRFMKVLLAVWGILKWVLIILAVCLALVYKDELLTILVYLGMFAGGGALLFAIVFHNGSLGALIGLGVGVLLGLRLVADDMGSGFNLVFLVGYYIVSAPFCWLNHLEHFLVAPWRYLFKRPWPSDSIKPVLRIFFDILTVLLYIAITPLRLLNAVIYNLLIHCVTVMYDLLFEVFMPCDPKEGASNVWRWILMFPWRLLKYPLFHGLLTVIESVIWTVVDIFVPAITMYHGTNLGASELIVRDTQRNKFLRNTSQWTYGTFMSSSDHNSSWGGKGVYFASNRAVARAYGSRAGSDDPVMIACRVSLGRVINYALTSNHVFNQTGPSGNHGELNKFGVDHHYVTGEWWNDGGDYWEYCMFDWKNRYNHPWRIRPVYVLNFRTGRAQHISGGMQHWLFDNAVLNDLFG